MGFEARALTINIAVAAIVTLMVGEAHSADHFVVPPKALVCLDVMDSNVDPIVRGLSWGFQTSLEGLRSRPDRSEDDGPFLSTNGPCDLSAGDIAIHVEARLDRRRDRYDLSLAAHAASGVYTDRILRRHAAAWGAEQPPVI